MQYVEDDMNDLFRRAADKYTPNPGDSGWKTIQPQLSTEPAVTASPVTERKAKNALYLLLLLPLLSGILVHYYDKIHADKKSLANSGNAVKQNNRQQNNNEFNHHKKTITVTTKNNAELGKTYYLKKIFRQENSYDTTQIIRHNDIESVYKNNFLSVYRTFKLSPPPFTREAAILPQITNADITSSASVNKILPVKQKRFYMGIAIGPEFNQVKSQGFKKAGLNAGVIAGYKLNKNVSVEAGLQYKKKYYFSDGKYFNMDKNISMPSDMKVLSLTGSSNVLEIPLGLKYQAVHKNAAALFATASISSNILLKENNNYRVSVNGVRQNMNGLYKKVSTGFASSVDFSIGYEYAIGKQSNVRIQPYLQIPVKSMGVGHMQVMSAGVNIAVTRSFH